MKKYHFKFKERPPSAVNETTVDAASLSSAIASIAKQGFVGREISNAYHTGLSTSMGMIGLDELIGRIVPEVIKNKHAKETHPEFAFAAEVDSQCNKNGGAKHE